MSDLADLIPSDDPLMTLAMLSGRADAQVNIALLAAALAIDPADVPDRYTDLVEQGLVGRRGHNYKLTAAGRERTHDEYERRCAPLDAARRRMLGD